MPGINTPRSGVSSDTTSILQNTSKNNPGPLDNAVKVIDFLKSAAGGSTMTKIGAELSKQNEIKLNLAKIFQEEQLIERLIAAYIAFRKKSKREHDRKDLNEAIEYQNKKSIKNQEKARKENLSSHSDEAFKQQLSDFLEQNSKTLRELESQLNKNIQEGTMLVSKLADIKVQEKQMEAKYEVYDAHLENAEPENTEKSTEEIQKMMDELMQEMHKMATEINDHLYQGNETQAKEILNQQNALNLKMAQLKDIHSVKDPGKEGEKYFADEHGNEINHKIQFKESTFILSRSEKLIKGDDNKLYLLKPGQDLQTMTVEDKKAANDHFEQSKPRIMNVKMVVKENKQMEKQYFADQVKEVDEALKVNREEKKELEVKMAVKQLERQVVLQVAQQPNLGIEGPKPSPKATTEEPDYKKRYQFQTKPRVELGPLPNTSPNVSQNVTPKPTSPTPFDTKPKPY